MMAESRQRGRGPGAGGRIGPRWLVPGLPQWSWSQRERGLVLFGSYAAALAVGLFAWGSPIGLAVLGFACAAHVASAADAIRQASFPGFGRWTPIVSATAGLGLGGYGPALALASVLAWPAGRPEAPRERFLVNRWAYLDDEPRPGDWVWFERPEGDGRGIGRVLAGSGQEVEWSDGRLWVDGVEMDRMPPADAPRPAELALTVPAGFVLVTPIGERGSSPSLVLGSLMVARGGILGRPWVQSEPIRERRILR